MLSGAAGAGTSLITSPTIAPSGITAFSNLSTST
jgi:hypothetical protein